MSGKRQDVGERWLDLHGMWSLMCWHIRAISAHVLAMTVIGAMFAMQLQTEFSADASIRIDRSEQGAGADRENLLSMASPPERSPTEIAMIKSRAVIEQAIAQLREYGSAEESLKTREEQSLDAKSGLIVVRETFIDINHVRKALEVVEVGKDSGVLRLTYRASSAGVAALTLQAIIDSYLRLKREHFAEEVAKEEAILDRQLPLLEKQLAWVREKAGRSNGDAQVSDLNRESDRLMVERGKVEAHISRLSGERSDMAHRYKDTHPAYKSLMEKITHFTKKKEEIDQQISRLPGRWRESSELLKDSENALQTYTYLLEKRHGLSLLKVKNKDRTWLVDDVRVAGITRAWPRRVQAILGGAIVGGLMGALYALWKYMALGLVYFAEDLRALGFKPLLGGKHSSQRTTCAIAHAARVVRRSVSSELEPGQFKLVVIGGEPSKELFAARMACAWAHDLSERVLIIATEEQVIGSVKSCLADEGWHESRSGGPADDLGFVSFGKERESGTVVFCPHWVQPGDPAGPLRQYGAVVFMVPDADRLIELPLCAEPIHAMIFHVPVGKKKSSILSEYRERAIDMGVSTAEIYALLD